MPEIHPHKRLRLWTLQSADDQGQLIVVTCDYCRITHHYLPKDLLRLSGDLSLDRLLSKFRCDGCGKKNYLRMKLHFPHGSEFGKLKVRRLKELKTVVIPVWSDDVLS